LNQKTMKISIPMWVLLSAAAPAISFVFGRLVLGESWSSCARDAYLAAIVVWIGAGLDRLRGAWDEIRHSRQGSAAE
jgi:hypothetical protein